MTAARELDTVIAAGLVALPLDPESLISLTGGMERNLDAVIVVSRYEQGVQVQGDTMHNADYLVRAIEAVFFPLRRVMADKDLGDSVAHSFAVVGIILDVLNNCSEYSHLTMLTEKGAVQDQRAPRDITRTGNRALQEGIGLTRLGQHAAKPPAHLFQA